MLPAPSGSSAEGGESRVTGLLGLLDFTNGGTLLL